MVLKNEELTAYMPEFKDKERIPNASYFANVSICVLQDNIPFLINHPS
mgnify:CR=1 FL=1